MSKNSKALILFYKTNQQTKWHNVSIEILDDIYDLNALNIFKELNIKLKFSSNKLYLQLDEFSPVVYLMRKKEKKKLSPNTINEIGFYTLFLINELFIYFKNPQEKSLESPNKEEQIAFIESQIEEKEMHAQKESTSSKKTKNKNKKSNKKVSSAIEKDDRLFSSENNIFKGVKSTSNTGEEFKSAENLKEAFPTLKKTKLLSLEENKPEECKSKINCATSSLSSKYVKKKGIFKKFAILDKIKYIVSGFRMKEGQLNQLNEIGLIFVDGNDNENYDFLVLNDFQWTKKLMLAICSGKPILSRNYLIDCISNKRVLEFDKYFFHDHELEKKYDFNFKESLEKANENENGFLFGIIFWAPPSSKLYKEVKIIITRSGGTFSSEEKASKTDYVVIHKEEKEIFDILKKEELNIYNHELIFVGCLRQSFEPEKYRF